MSFAPEIELHVREAIASDAPRIVALAAQLGYDVMPSHVEDVLSQRAAEREIFVAVVPRAGVVGWLEAASRIALVVARTAHVDGLVVDEEYRGAGIGGKLLARAERWAREAGCASVSVHSNVIRERAHAFYERAGYERVKSQHLLRKMLTP